MSTSATQPRQGLPPVPPLQVYECGGYDKKRRRTCTATIFDGSSSRGAYIRRRCLICGCWRLIYVYPDPDWPI